MRAEGYLHSIAAFLIALVLTIPFHITGAYASINKVSVKGSSGIEGYAKANDFLNINVQASIPGETITNDRIVLGSSRQFDKCTASISNGSECTLRFPGNGTEPFEPKSIPFTINLFKDDKTLDDSEAGTVTIDTKPPLVKLSSSSKFSSQQNVVINYDVADFACDDLSCSSKCAGIKSIEFFTLNGAFSQAVNPTASDCSIKSSIAIDPKTFSDGKNSVFAKATDKFSHVSAETSVTFEVDSSPPLVASNSLSILRKGVDISSFSSAGISVDVVVNISGKDLNLTSVKADLSSLNPSQQNLKSAKASCASVKDGISTCKWPVELNPGTGGLKTIFINSSDASGNTESAEISRQFSLDDQGPVVQSLSIPPIAEGGQYIAKPSGNKVTAVFEEATGLIADEVFLHINQQSKVKAAKCGKEAGWTCVWENVEFGKGGQISVQSDTTDIFGNAIVQGSSIEVRVDPNAPVLKSIEITNVGGLVQAFPGFAKIGDKIAVSANLIEESDITAVADFSPFVGGASKVAGQCERLQADQQVCTWISDSINLQASGVIKFNFSDNVGNTQFITKPFRTFGVENATVPNFWGSVAVCSPKAIDRELGPLINQRVYCQVFLQQNSSTRTVSTVFIGPATCSGNGSSVVQGVEMVNNKAGSVTPIIKLTLKKDDFRINKADLSCSFDIFSKIGSSTTITRNPEIENVKISLEFFNLPLGELSQKVKDKIKEAKDDAEDLSDLIDTLNKIVFYAKKICQIIGIIYNIVTVLYTAYLIWKGSSDTTCVSVIFSAFCPNARALAFNQCLTAENKADTADGIKGAADKFCHFVNCRITILWGPQVQNFINNNLPGAQFIGPKTEVKDEGFGGFFGSASPQSDASGKQPGFDPSGKPLGFGQPVSYYMNPQNNLLVATLFACLPGIIYGLDKYRQIKCLYADCLENAVGKEGLPVSACDDQKAYATCKYITGEIFAVIPYTAVFDHFMRLIKNTLSNPFAIIGIAASLLCKGACAADQTAVGSPFYTACRYARLFNTIGDVVQNIKSMIDEGFKIRQDYCDRLEDEDDDDDEDDKDKKVEQPEPKKK